jgi:hypothetical protein
LIVVVVLRRAKVNSSIPTTGRKLMTCTLLYHIFRGTNITAKAFYKKDLAKRLLLGIEMSVHVLTNRVEIFLFIWYAF